MFTQQRIKVCACVCELKEFLGVHVCMRDQAIQRISIMYLFHCSFAFLRRMSTHTYTAQGAHMCIGVCRANERNVQCLCLRNTPHLKPYCMPACLSAYSLHTCVCVHLGEWYCTNLLRYRQSTRHRMKHFSIKVSSHVHRITIIMKRSSQFFQLNFHIQLLLSSNRSHRFFFRLHEFIEKITLVTSNKGDLFP